MTNYILLIVIGIFILSSFLFYLSIDFGIKCGSISTQLDRFYGFESQQCSLGIISIILGIILSGLGIVMILKFGRKSYDHWLGARNQDKNYNYNHKGINQYGLTIMVIVFMVVFFYFVIVYSIGYEYIPKNDLENIYRPNKNMAVLLTRESTILIPMRNLFSPVVSTIKVVVDYEPPIKDIRSIKLSTTSDSVLSYYGDFKLIGEKDSVPTSYAMNVTTNHDLTLENTSAPYTVDIFYTNQSNPSQTGQLGHTSISFSWPIKTLDLSLFTYFWIVLIGIIVGRATTAYFERTKKEQKDANKAHDTLGRINTKDLFLIGVSGIIALLIFSNFEREVNLTGNVLINISLAFAFGFGVDRSLEAVQKFRSGE